MTSITPGPRNPARSKPIPAGLREKLLGAIRPEFRGDEVAFAVDDPVFGTTPCAVPGCSRATRTQGLCGAHYQRWQYFGRPDMSEFVATARLIGQRPRMPAGCIVDSCNFAASTRRLCHSHHYVWQQLGSPELPAGLALLKPLALDKRPTDCLVTGCPRWAQPHSDLCRPHQARWREHDRPPVEEFALTANDPRPLPPGERIIVTALPAHLRQEMQYTLQCRRDEAAGKTAPATVNAAVLLLATVGVTSMLERTEEQWRELAPNRTTSRRDVIQLIIYGRRKLETLLGGVGWESEYPRDVWRLHNLGLSTTNAVLRFDGIPQPWLRELAKRWLRWRLSTGSSKSTCLLSTRSLTHFAAFLATHTPEVERLADVGRVVLERYLAHLRLMTASAQYQASFICALNTFFTTIRRHRWDTSLPTETLFFTSDYPKRPAMLPRALAEHIMAQVEAPANLNRWEHPAHQLTTLILMRCGLRITDALKLAFDCVVRDSENAPYLRYFNHKMKREALVPIDEELEQLINRQQQRVRQRWPGGVPVLFPRQMNNADGTRPTGSDTYRAALYRWLACCDVRDERGQPFHLTPHRWRHTLATRLINRDVPQEVVRRILDHDSPQMTAHYARLHDSTIRAHWEKARKVNISGDTVTLDPDGPLAEATWAKHRLSRATQALPNGYCGLPIQQSCPHANSCLTCPMFLTTAEFLPQHRHQRNELLQIISAAEARGQQRLAEMNRTVVTNLDTIIALLTKDSPDEGHSHAS
ncbi:tyrosine-type recombinase/integrase [Nonomuraea antri]|uniref:tyrosine-type recombinase/integrase n=1 Tax=Nonomuraea antri TaxID=2730852 RepID=UPI001C2C536D|nr:tyrosine-type recombinase/integrase [Nonomuraea antri]